MDRFDLITMVGALLMAVGAGLISVPAGLIVGGIVCLMFGIIGAIVHSRSRSRP